MPDQISVAVLGAGYRANEHLKTLSRLARYCRIVGVCDAIAERREKAAADYQVPAFDRLEAMLDAARPDLLYIVIPPDAHHLAAEVAARRGVHLITETPIATTLPMADRMIAAARMHRVHLEVAENVWRWPTERLKQLIVASGLIGELTQAHLWYTSGSYHGVNAVRKLIGRRPIRALGAAREVRVPLHPDLLGRPSDVSTWELGQVEFERGLNLVYQWPVDFYLRSRWDVIGTEGNLVGSELTLVRNGAKQTFPLRTETSDTPAGTRLDRVVVDTDPPITWENPLRDDPIGATQDEVARADILVTMYRAIVGGGAPGYGAVNARADQEILIAVRESARLDSTWVDLPLSSVTGIEQRIHAEYAAKYGFDPLDPPDDALDVLFPRLGVPQTA